MLAYELYRINNDSNEVAGNGMPIKKIFVDQDDITIDDTAIQKYGFTNTSNNLKKYFQENLDMAIDTNPRLNLPKKIVGSNSPKPYVKISGYATIYRKNTKKNDDGQKQLTGEITLGDKPKKGAKQKPFAKLSIPDYTSDISEVDLPLKMNKIDYVVGDETIYQLYQKNKIIQNNVLTASLFKKIAEKFFNFIKDRNIEFVNGKTSFALYVLPTKDQITFKEKNGGGDTFTDSFGNESNEYSDSPTQGVFFISYDDKAFTINCKQKQKFYKDLGIGEKSAENILLPENKKNIISGFNWYFIDTEHGSRVFRETKKGIYAQLYDNYNDLKGDKDADVLSAYKVICIKKTNAKLEIMIDENLTMPRLQNMFRHIENETDIELFAYENCLIIKKGKSTTYRYYVSAIKSLLNQTPFNQDLLLKIFTEQVKNQVREWLDEKTNKSALKFFKQSEFCSKTLKYMIPDNNSVEQITEFATKVGVMARVYVDFRKETKNDNNSLRELLSKPKYDVDTLKYVIQSIGRGIHLLNISHEQYNKILAKLTRITQSKDFELEDDNYKDLSYYFYKGYFKGDENK